MNGLCDYVPETNVKGKLHEYMEQAKHYAKRNGIGIWSEDENPETTEARIHTSEKKTSNRTSFRLQLQETLIHLTAEDIDIQRSYPNTKIRAVETGEQSRMAMLSSWMNHGTTNTSLTMSIVPKTKNKDLTATVRFNNEVLNI